MERLGQQFWLIHNLQAQARLLPFLGGLSARSNQIQQFLRLSLKWTSLSTRSIGLFSRAQPPCSLSSAFLQPLHPCYNAFSTRSSVKS